MMQRFGAGDVFRQPARRVVLNAYLLYVYDTFASYTQADSQLEWRKHHPQGADLIDRVKEWIDRD
jgi:hypothetical protein